MFSGIVEETARVVSLENRETYCRLLIESGLDHALTKLGDSICIDGVCLTVVSKDGAKLGFDLASETLRRSTLADLRVGSLVNLERSLSLGDRLHGHFVFGHVDATVELAKVEDQGTCQRLSFKVPAELRRFVVPKGSVSISGTSLTVGEVGPDWFSVYIIPHTEQVTTFSKLAVGDRANLEIDMLARYVDSLFGSKGLELKVANRD